MIYNIHILNGKDFLSENRNQKPNVDNVFGNISGKFFVIAEICGNDVYAEEITAKEYCDYRFRKHSNYWDINKIS